MVLKKQEVHFSLIISSLSCVSKLNLQYTASLERGVFFESRKISEPSNTGGVFHCT